MALRNRELHARNDDDDTRHFVLPAAAVVIISVVIDRATVPSPSSSLLGMWACRMLNMLIKVIRLSLLTIMVGSLA